MEAIEYQAKVETLAEDILTDRQLSVDYDRKRQENRAALHQLRQQAKAENPHSIHSRATLNMGDFFIDVPTTKALTMVQNAQAELETAISDVSARLKQKTASLAELEGDDKTATALHAMQLKPVTGQDLYNINQRK
ncbi:hypothetical protein EC988_005115 [Linderina pennispora]|nr:hypothetical protein EC988_005115 [Linderina pennispora]